MAKSKARKKVVKKAATKVAKKPAKKSVTKPAAKAAKGSATRPAMAADVKLAITTPVRVAPRRQLSLFPRELPAFRGKE
jgi:hypothetical protein